MENESDAWYPHASDYWVPVAEQENYPLRYGDLCHTPGLEGCRTGKGRPWRAVLVLSPSCELGAKAANDTEVLVARVNRVADIGESQRSAVRVGWAERDGRVFAAHSNTFWLPPAPSQETAIDLYADFRRIQAVPLDAVLAAGRIAAMSHDARVYLIRREMYFKYRWKVAIAHVRELEKSRISADRDFAGPRPDWAP